MRPLERFANKRFDMRLKVVGIRHSKFSIRVATTGPETHKRLVPLPIYPLDHADLVGGRLLVHHRERALGRGDVEA